MKLRNFFIILSCAALLCSCSSGKNEIEAERTVFAMDTVMDLRAYGENAEFVLSEAENEINRLENSLSRGREGSDIYRINETRDAEVNPEIADIIHKALEISSSTDGAFDITIAPVMDLWGFFTKEFHVPSDDELSAALESVDYNNVAEYGNKAVGNRIVLKGNSRLDLGGIAKGYLSDDIMKVFKSYDIKSGIVSLGGNVQCLGKKPDGSKWKVAIQNPDGGDFIGTVSVSDMAVITSGGYQRFFEQDGVTYHHIIDPKTGYSAKSGLKSVTVISNDAVLADGLSTSFYVMGLEDSLDYWRSHDDFEAVLMTDDNKIYITEGLDGIFESSLGYEIAER